MKLKLFYICLAFLLHVAAAAANDKSLGAIFLNEPVGARASAMGEAFVGMAEDSQSMFWNPAGLVHIGDVELLITHTEFIQDYRHEYFALNLPISNRDALGLQGYLAYIHGLEKTMTINDDLELYSAYDSYLGAAWSHRWNQRLSTGVSGKVIYQTIDNYSAWSLAADLGLHYTDLVPDLALGLTIKHVGLPMTFIEKAHPLPLTMELGAAYRLINRKLLMTLDIAKPIAQEFTFKIGGEYSINDLVFIRTGYKYLQYGNDLGPLSGLTVGVGADVADYYLDYAFTPYADLGHVHRIALTMHFGRSQLSKKEIAKQLTEEIRQKQKELIQGYIDSGRRAMNQGQYKQALFYYNRVLLLNPNLQDVKQRKIIAERNLKGQEAKELFNQGLRAYKQKNYLDALIEWSKAQDINPQDPIINKWLARVNRKLATRKTRSLSAQHQNGTFYSQGLGYLRNGEYQQAVSAWKGLLANDPNNTKVKNYLKITKRKMREEVNRLLGQARTDWEQQDYAAAVKKWKTVLKKYPDQPEAKQALVGNQAIIQNYAEELYRQGIQNYVNNRLVEAITNWQTVLILEPDNKRAENNLKRAQRKIEEMELIEEK